MGIRSVVCSLAVAVLSVPALVAAQIEITPVATGLSSPVFVGHAGDGSNRLFIEERGGIIRVAQPGAQTATIFLDISGKGKIVAGGEQGLLGLAFHPQYAGNGRFFVFYTRGGDGALVIAEYRVSADRNVADAASEKVLLTIPHPGQTNHNGGMLAFGPDGYLYIGTGDGGSGNDPPNNAQNVNSLLGKILRIDVNTPSGYLSPLSNPFYGSIEGRDEIFAFGIRNPWRFSFDRASGQQWLGDVGQSLREEVNAPIVNGGNYGWRFFEGTQCNMNINPINCDPATKIFPVFEYSHAGGRCSLTGGYAYRGSQGTLPAGTYVYGDYCSGEILAWNGSAQTVLLDTTMNISSFGEDEAGEIYVVNLGGTVGRITSTTPSCSYSIAPTSQNVSAGGGPGTVAVTAGAGCDWTSTPNASWLHVTAGATGTGNGSVEYAVDANTTSTSRNGTMSIAGQTFTVNQSGAAPCTFSISPTSATYQPTGGNGSVAVSAVAGCSWTATSQATWITVTGASGSGNGNGTVTYAVAPYSGKGPRTRNGSITVAGHTFSVRQTR